MSNFQWVIPQNAMVTAKSIDGLSDVVVTINAYREISDGTTSTQIPVCVGLTPPPEDFIPYANLTQEIVEGWLNSNLDVISLDEELTIQLYNIINPKIQVLPNPF
jgi:hypothetical protein